MIFNIFKTIKEILFSRIFYISLVFVAFAFALVFRLYNLQIVTADNVEESEEVYYTVKERLIPATRGMIYDRNGVLLAYNDLSYAVFLEDSAVVTKNADKNRIIHELFSILKKHNVPHELEFAIELDEDNNLRFNVSGNAELRFKKNAYGLRSVNNLTEAQKNATAEQVFDFLCNGTKSTSMFGVSDEYTLEEKLEIVMVRYYYFTMTDRSSQITVAINVDDNTIAAILEASGELTGVSVQQQTKRHYTEEYAVSMAHILGYTGRINETELENFLEAGIDKYTSTDYIGKTGIEASYEDVLSGTKGVEQLVLADNGRIISSEIIKEPIPGENIYLSIDATLQNDYYDILETNIAASVLGMLTRELDYGTKGENSDKILIPVYEVYYSLFSNNVISMDSIASGQGTSMEIDTFQKYLNYKSNVIKALSDYVAYGNKKLSTSLSDVNQDFLAYFYQKMRAIGYLPQVNIDETSSHYQDYNNDRISFYEYIVACINAEWVDLEKLGIEGNFYTTEEIYRILMGKTMESFENDNTFDLMVYRNLIFSYKLSGKQICLLLFDQNVLKYDEIKYKALSRGSLDPFDFVKEIITTKQITPAQLALQPDSGSVVQTDAVTGQVIALVSYPSYDLNRLANRIDWDYYQKLLNDKSNPLYCRATQQRTATGSTIKPLIGICGFQNDELGLNERIYDKVVFDKINPSPSCHYIYGHGNVDVSGAIQVSCNYFFYEIAYRLSTKGIDKYSDSLGINYISKTARQFGFGENTGIEISEAAPSIAESDAVRCSIGYVHKFTATSISKYATGIANRGKVMEYTLIQKMTDKNEQTIFEASPVVYNNVPDVSNAEWNKIIDGMRSVISATSYATIGGHDWCGKTGTAEVSAFEPAHALTIAFAPKNNPETTMTVVIPNGNQSNIAQKCTKELYERYYIDDINALNDTK